MSPFPSRLQNPTVAYTGRAGQLWVLMAVNLLLTVVTLGTFRFWARTRLRRHLWAHTLIGGEALEYTGTGNELFRGFLRALLVIGPVVLAFLVLEFLFPPEGRMPAEIMLWLVVLYLAHLAVFGAQRYRFRRTTWRGIRCDINGSAGAYARSMLGRTLLLPLTLFTAIPWMTAARLRRTLGEARYGSARFAFGGTGNGLVNAFFAALLAVTPLAILGFWGIGAGIGPHLWPDITDAETRKGAIDLTQEVATLALLVVLFVVASTIYGAATLPFIFKELSLAAPDGSRLHFGFKAGMARTMAFLFGNVLLTLLSLGLLAPLALHRRMRFVGDNVIANGALALDAIRQADAGEAHGEGLADTFGLETGLT